MFSIFIHLSSKEFCVRTNIYINDDILTFFMKQLTFLIDETKAKKFKMFCLENDVDMSEFFRRSVESAIN